jgi:ribosomal protein S27E
MSNETQERAAAALQSIAESLSRMVPSASAPDNLRGMKLSETPGARCPYCEAAGVTVFFRAVTAFGCSSCITDLVNPAAAKAIKDRDAAIRDAGYRAAPDLLGALTLWCRECGRDSGLHTSQCSRIMRSP